MHEKIQMSKIKKYTLFSFTQKTTQHYFGSSKYRKRCTQISFELVSTSRGNVLYVPNLENHQVVGGNLFDSIRIARNFTMMKRKFFGKDNPINVYSHKGCCRKKTRVEIEFSFCRHRSDR